MKYVVGVFLLVPLTYLLSFAGHNWRNKNRLAAIGSAILGIAAIGLAFFVIFIGNHEM